MQNFKKAGHYHYACSLLKKVRICRISIAVLLLLPFVSIAQTQPLINSTLKGQVIDSLTKQGIPGVSIHITGTTHTVQTDPDGRFDFVTGQKFPYTLEIRHISYEKKDVVANGSPILIRLKEITGQLNDVVIIGYGTQQRKDLIGSVSKIDPSGTKNIPEAGFDAQLQGKAAGVQINSNTGVPGSDIFIRVRGATSINATNDPLYIIDGVWVNNNSLQNIAQERATSPLSDLNPSDIESIEILKDATAIAIYGSRGANGIVLVTTKRGNFGQKTRIEFNGSEGLGWAPEDRVWKTTTGAEHAALINEYSRNMGKAQPFRPASEVINGVAGRGLPEEQPTYDRMSYLNRTASLRSYDLSLQGGSDRTRFYLGGGYTDQESIWKPMSFDRASLKVNLDHKLNSKIALGSSNAISRSHRNQARPANGANGTLLQASLNIPTYLPIFDEKGTPLKWVNFDNIAVLTGTVNLWSYSYHYIGNIYLDYAITPKLKFRSTFGVDYNNYEENEYWDTRTILGNSGGRGSQSITQSSTAINEQTLAYSDKVGKHSFGILIGNTLQGAEVKNVSATGTNFPNNSYTQISSAATQIAGQFKTTSTLASFFSRADYNYAGKYYAEFTLRADGSSKFGKNNKWGYFPAVGAAWRVKEENFLKDVPQISNLKYRISYGITGNQAGINDFASQGLWTGGFGYADVAGGAELPGTAPLQLANPDLKWESTAQFSTGIDIGLFEDKLNIEFNYYNKYTSDALLQVAVPGSSGFSSYLTNFGEISNKGFELAINSTNLRTTGFTWKTDFNIARNKNTIEKIPADIPFAGRDLIRLQQGKELYSYWLYKQLSVNPENGDAVFDDYNKDGKITADDRQIVGSTWPKFFGGLTNNFTYKGLDLGIFFTFSYGNYIWNHNRMLGETGGTLDAGRVLLKSQLDRWTSPGQITNTPKLNDANYARQENSRFFEDASFLRLRSLTLGYTLPKAFTSRIKIEKLRFYVIGSNLLLFTKYTGADPESNLGTQNIQGYDYGTPPQPRTVQLGLNVTL
ncbi:SusC/RagA family TonB-linked outer membrane protein [Pedobacter africanus]|uniref:TonB-linked outer membrane protein, SusC/RagA family n=1 Tax=Pedobacter africanus TaxID=151894 RepID=A0A1W2AFV1_9SPHI|nr:TonB-dependent receptor [Pedobacter africanus]SMC59460.1 TonB-linked outer membrane protein, SusC/RagA family [Pedobacter africanus]